MALLGLVGLLVASGIPWARATETPTIVGTNSGMSYDNGVCKLWNEYRYTASKGWVENFKAVAVSAQLGEVISESPQGELTSLVFRKTISGSGLCTQTRGGVWTYVKTGLASFAANVAYVGVLSGVQIAAALNGYQPDDPKVSVVAGCLAGAISNGVSNAILGLTDWRQILSGAIVSCAVDSPGYAVASKIFTFAQRLANRHRTAPPGASTVEVATREQVEDEAAIDIGQLGG
ncbi:MAG TPA: hypothetical protein VI248_04120 [Kineosporiaceae bacterium]